MRLVALPATLVAAFFVGSGPGSVTPRTVVRTKVTPIDAHGDLRAGLRVSREAHGSCEPGSASLPNNVYRCFSGNFVVDPCWRDWLAVVPTVICLEEPWAETVVRLRLSAPPKPASGRSDLGTEPSGITLRSGRRCLAAQGAHDTLTGKGDGPVIDYYCGKTLALVRGINRSRAAWTIRAARITHHLSHAYALVGWVPIKTAWYGGNDPLSHRP
jgi:hypothetical protein